MEINLKDNDYEILDISPVCYNCFHHITIKNISSGIINTHPFSGVQIAEYYKYKKINIPQHFVEYITSKN